MARAVLIRTIISRHLGAPAASTLNPRKGQLINLHRSLGYLKVLCITSCVVAARWRTWSGLCNP